MHGEAMKFAEVLFSCIKDAGPCSQLIKKFPAFYGTNRSISLHDIPSLVPVLSQMNPLSTITQSL